MGQVWNQTLEFQSQSDKSEPLMFLIHLIGDLTQPLHVCGRDYGGNGNFVKFDGMNRVSLHQIWDSNMVRKRAKMFENDRAYISHLNNLAKSLDEKVVIKEDVVLEWTKDTQRVDCEQVWKEWDRDAKQNFGGSYFETHKETIDLQLAKAGYRLGKWLDLLLTGKRGRDDDMDAIKPVKLRKSERIKKVYGVRKIEKVEMDVDEDFNLNGEEESRFVDIGEITFVSQGRPHVEKIYKTSAMDDEIASRIEGTSTLRRSSRFKAENKLVEEARSLRRSGRFFNLLDLETEAPMTEDGEEDGDELFAVERELRRSSRIQNLKSHEFEIEDEMEVDEQPRRSERIRELE